jgi:hypothetical protein
MEQNRGKNKGKTIKNLVTGVRQNSSIGGFCLFFRETVSSRRGTFVA